MNLILKCLLVYFFLNGSASLVQSDVKYQLIFHPQVGNTALLLNDSFYKLRNGDSIQIELLKFYISGIELLNNDKLVWKEENSFHLMDASKSESFVVSLNMPSGISFNKVKFNMGIDSVTNVSGAIGGDLDPTRGMYWTWQSGYVNFKLEGRSNRCTSVKNEFQFHLGGYLPPFTSLQTVTLNVTKKEKIDVVLNIEQFIGSIDLAKQNHIMTPGKETVTLSQSLAKSFYLKKE